MSGSLFENKIGTNGAEVEGFVVHQPVDRIPRAPLRATDTRSRPLRLASNAALHHQNWTLNLSREPQRIRRFDSGNDKGGSWLFHDARKNTIRCPFRRWASRSGPCGRGI